MIRIGVVDSHTGGEPTRLVTSGGPDLGPGSLADRVKRFQAKFDHYRSAIVNEPRGSDPVVGALLCQPHRVDCQFGVIFFNNVGYLGMCGHGTIGVIASLAHTGHLSPGIFKIDTPVGAVEACLHSDGQVEISNVPSFRKAHDIAIQVPGIGTVRGDIAWGGNWFYLIADHNRELTLAKVENLTDYAWRVRQTLNAQGHPEVDHIEMFGAPSNDSADSRNFVLCPGKAYDRSPCGTGTSAKLACLGADGELEEGELWHQESFLGSTFTARYRWLDRSKGEIEPFIMGRAYVTGESTLLLIQGDPFCWGIRR